MQSVKFHFGGDVEEALGSMGCQPLDERANGNVGK